MRAATETFVAFDAEPGRPVRTFDAATALTIYLGLTYLIPQKLVLGVAGAIGQPGVLFGIGLLFWWALSRLAPELVTRGRQPVRIVIFAYLGIYMLSYILGFARGLPFDEQTNSDRELLQMLSLAGIALIAVDGLRTRAQVDRVLRRLCGFGVVMAVTGVLQFFFAYDVNERFLSGLPFFEVNGEDPLSGLLPELRSDHTRVYGTTGHPIEFGVMAAMLLPLAIHFLLFASPGKERRRWQLITLLIGISVPISISRSGFVGLGVALIIMFSVWSKEIVKRALVYGGLATIAFRAMVPGLLGSLTKLLTNYQNDESYQARARDYPIALGYIRERPWLGRGPGTFLPGKYILLDNQLLLTLIQTGWIGLTALVGVFAAGATMGRMTLRFARDAETRHLGNAITATLLCSLATAYLADMLFYRIYSGTTFLLVGLAGALFRTRNEIVRPERPSDPLPVLRRHWNPNDPQCPTVSRAVAR